MPIMVNWRQTNCQWGEEFQLMWHQESMSESDCCSGSRNTREQWKFHLKINQWWSMTNTAWSKHRKRSESRVPVTTIQEGGIQSLAGVEIVGKDPGIGCKCSRYWNWSAHGEKRERNKAVIQILTQHHCERIGQVHYFWVFWESRLKPLKFHLTKP